MTSNALSRLSFLVALGCDESFIAEPKSISELPTKLIVATNQAYPNMSDFNYPPYVSFFSSPSLFTAFASIFSPSE
jgi:hypothetical protein